MNFTMQFYIFVDFCIIAHFITISREFMYQITYFSLHIVTIGTCRSSFYSWFAWRKTGFYYFAIMKVTFKKPFMWMTKISIVSDIIDIEWSQNFLKKCKIIVYWASHYIAENQCSDKQKPFYRANMENKFDFWRFIQAVFSSHISYILVEIQWIEKLSFP